MKVTADDLMIRTFDNSWISLFEKDRVYLDCMMKSLSLLDFDGEKVNTTIDVVFDEMKYVIDKRMRSFNDLKLTSMMIGLDTSKIIINVKDKVVTISLDYDTGVAIMRIDPNFLELVDDSDIDFM